MKSAYQPIAMIIFGGVLYQISQKSVPHTASPLHAIIIAYLAGIAFCVFFAFFYTTEKSFFESFKETNWAIFTVGIGAALLRMALLERRAHRNG